MYLGPDLSTGFPGFTGEIIFGGYDPQYTSEEFTFVSVKDASETLFWCADMTTMGFGDSVNLTTTTNMPAIFDSGTSLMTLPQSVFEQPRQSDTSSGSVCQSQRPDRTAPDQL